jgi:hypothetical protein
MTVCSLQNLTSAIVANSHAGQYFNKAKGGIYFHFTNTIAPYSEGRKFQFALHDIEDNAPLLLAYFRLYSVLCWCIRTESDDKSREHCALVESCFRGKIRPMHVRLQLPVHDLHVLEKRWLEIDCALNKSVLSFSRCRASLTLSTLSQHDYSLMIVIRTDAVLE